MSKLEVINRYFDARARSNLSALQEIFDPDIEIYNVHLPVFRGREGIERYNSDFKGRIAYCEFEILEVLERENLALVEWKAELKYKKGAQVAGVEVAEPFILELRGVNRFDFRDGKIQCLRIYHETTTVVNLAKEHAIS